MEKQTVLEKAKRSYDFFKNIGNLQEIYPHLTGDWEEDKDFWFEEHCEQMERMTNTFNPDNE